jgi:hypothetical protein
MAGALILCMVAAALAQRRFDELGGFGGYGRVPPIHNVPYDGQFTFVRVQYDTAPGGYWAGGRPSWVHGYPVAEGHLMRIMNDLSFFNARTDEVNVISLEDPELFKYPLAYIIEVGWWTLTDAGAAALRTYIEKGGFVIVDDFKMLGWRGNDTGGWEPFERNMNRVFPGVKFFDMDMSHPIFHAFFEIRTLDVPQYYDPPPAIFRAIYENNDPTRRILVMINYNTDISEFWEWSDTGLKPIDESTEAYKLGVNYIIYGMTH